jgi:hypothetical protein
MSGGLSFGNSDVLFDNKQLKIILNISLKESSFTQHILSSHQSKHSQHH